MTRYERVELVWVRCITCGKRTCWWATKGVPRYPRYAMWCRTEQRDTIHEEER